MKDEVAACDDDRSMNNIVILKKVLINELTLALSTLALDAVNGLGINLDKIVRHVNQGQGRQHLHRRHLPKHELNGCHSFFSCGRVVSASVVANLNRQLVRHRLVPGWVGEVGYGRTDMCLGWYVKPARVRKEQVKIDETEEPSKSTSNKRKSSAKSKATLAEEIATHAIGQFSHVADWKNKSPANTTVRCTNSAASVVFCAGCSDVANCGARTSHSSCNRPAICCLPPLPPPPPSPSPTILVEELEGLALPCEARVKAGRMQFHPTQLHPEITDAFKIFIPATV